MNTFLKASFLFLFSGASLTIAAEDKPMHVGASQDLRLAIVDSAKPSKARDAQHAAFADSLGEAVGKQCGGTVGVKAKCVSADSAAFNLGTGVYDAVFVIGNTLPRPLMISDVSRLTAVMGSGKAEKKVYLIFGSSDTTLAGFLSASFSVALNNPKFLNSTNDAGGQAAGTGEKLASTAP